jgi:hypothetical protein
MKLGFNEDKPLIEGEYNIYEHLQQNGVPTPKVHGLFQDRDPDGATAILMDHAGTRIDQVPGGLSEAQRCVRSLVPIVHSLIQPAERHSADFFDRFIMQESYIMTSLHETCSSVMQVDQSLSTSEMPLLSRGRNERLSRVKCRSSVVFLVNVRARKDLIPRCGLRMPEVPALLLSLSFRPLNLSPLLFLEGVHQMNYIPHSSLSP